MTEITRDLSSVVTNCRDSIKRIAGAIKSAEEFSSQIKDEYGTKVLVDGKEEISDSLESAHLMSIDAIKSSFIGAVDARTGKMITSVSSDDLEAAISKLQESNDISQRKKGKSTKRLFNLEEVAMIRDELDYILDYRTMHKPAVVSVQGNKGGGGKTTTSVAISTCAALDLAENPRVLLVDLDPQSSCLRALISKRDLNKNNSEFVTAIDLVLSGVQEDKSWNTADFYRREYDMSFEDIVLNAPLSTHYPNLDLLPSTWLDGRFSSEPSLSPKTDEEFNLRLRRFADEIIPILKTKYDIIVLDTPPNAQRITLMAHAAADMVLCPVQLNSLDIDSQKQFILDMPRISAGWGEDHLRDFRIVPVMREPSCPIQSGNFSDLKRLCGDALMDISIERSDAYKIATQRECSIRDINTKGVRAVEGCSKAKFDRAIANQKDFYLAYMAQIKSVMNKQIK